MLIFLYYESQILKFDPNSVHLKSSIKELGLVFLNRFVISSHTFDTYKNAVLNSPYDETFNSQLKSFIEFNDKHRKLNGVELFKDILW